MKILPWQCKCIIHLLASRISSCGAAIFTLGMRICFFFTCFFKCLIKKITKWPLHWVLKEFYIKKKEFLLFIKNKRIEGVISFLLSALLPIFHSSERVFPLAYFLFFLLFHLPFANDIYLNRWVLHFFFAVAWIALALLSRCWCVFGQCVRVQIDNFKGFWRATF